MKILNGQILKSTSLLNNTIFENTEILICENNQLGAWGFVINQPNDRGLNELVEFQMLPKFTLLKGGPMENEKLFFVHSLPHLIANGQALTDKLYFGGDFNEAIELIKKQEVSINDLKFFLGYCGWDYKQLEQELEEGSWILI